MKTKVVINIMGTESDEQQSWIAIAINDSVIVLNTQDGWSNPSDYSLSLAEFIKTYHASRVLHTIERVV